MRVDPVPVEGPGIPLQPPASIEDKTDYDFIRDWVSRGMPDDEISYPEEAPPTSKDQWLTATDVSVLISGSKA